MPKSKTLKTRCVKNIKSGRCTLSEVEDETSKDCLYNQYNKRCTNNVTKKRVPDYKRVGVVILGKNVNKNVVPYLEKLVYKKSPAVIRQRNAGLEYPFPLDEYPDDQKMKDYLVEDILQLAYYADMDYGTHGKGPISLKMIKLVLEHNEDLDMILK